jgi:hypothetical protein
MFMSLFDVAKSLSRFKIRVECNKEWGMKKARERISQACYKGNVCAGTRTADKKRAGGCDL